MSNPILPKLFWPGMTLLLAAIAVLLFIPSSDLPAALKLDPKMAEAGAKVVGGLLVIALMLERALAVVIDLLFGQEQADANQKLAVARDESQLAEALAAASAVDVKRERARLMLGFIAAFLISAAGVRTLDGLLAVDSSGKSLSMLGSFAIGVDILLTAGLLAGGSNGLAKLIEVLQTRANERRIAARLALARG